MYLYIHSFSLCGAFETDRKWLVVRAQLASSNLRQKLGRNVVATVTVGFCLEASCHALKKQNHWNCRNQTLKTMAVCVSVRLSRMYLLFRCLSNLCDSCNPSVSHRTAWLYSRLVFGTCLVRILAGKRVLLTDVVFLSPSRPTPV